MATRNLVPRADSEGGIGTTLKRWAAGWFDAINGKDITGGVATSGELSAHTGRTDNPHGVTYTQAGAAPATQGVTNGDAHDHSGGDGGQIAHTALSGVGTNTHAQIDAFVSSKATAGGLASLDGSGNVEQNPANATATPTAGKIAIADGGGKLDSWVTDATTSAKGKVQLSTSTEAKAGTDAVKAITPSTLAAATKILIAVNTTIYVRTDGSDSNDGTANDAAHAKLTIAGALSSIAGKVIASGVTVTIQVADGTYAVSSTITIDHPDADKIRIYGNTGTETVVAITALDTGTSKITVAGDQTAVSGLFAGAILQITGSSTSGLNGSYTVSTVTYTGGNTEIVTTQAIPSATVGGGSIRCKPANLCVLSCASGVIGFTITKPFWGINGIRLNCGGGTSYGVYASTGQTKLYSVITDGFQNGFMIAYMSYATMNSCVGINCQYGITSQNGSNVLFLSNACVFSFCSIAGLRAKQMAFILANPATVNGNTADYTPALNTVGNSNSIIATS